MTNLPTPGTEALKLARPSGGDFTKELAKARRLRQLLFFLVVVLTFEGIARKAFPLYSVELFLFKDVIVAVMAFYVLRMTQPPAIAFLWNAYIAVAILFVPLVAVTAWHDPVLAVFGANQYFLFPMVGFATFLAFYRETRETMLRFFLWLSLLVIPTALLALLQSHLPVDHWLNMSVRGETMEGFSAAGELRVSSTFSFVAQYCVFLNAETFIIMIALNQWRQRSFPWKIVCLSLIPFLVLSSFITGSRGAVMGNTAIVLLALALALMKFQFRQVFQIGVVIVSLYLAALAVNHFSPSTTAAYSERDNGHLVGISGEIWDRVIGSFFNVSHDQAMTTWFGNGLGVMSNGSGSISPYAGSWRNYLWTETDFSSVLFEGGYYMVVIWYGFRLYILFVTTRRFLQEVTGDLSIPAAFTQAFAVVVGVLGTLGTQPPVAIWWWMSVGTSLLFWWKCVGPGESELAAENQVALAPKKKTRGRSLYADALHPPR